METATSSCSGYRWPHHPRSLLCAGTDMLSVCQSCLGHCDILLGRVAASVLKCPVWLHPVRPVDSYQVSTWTITKNWQLPEPRSGSHSVLHLDTSTSRDVFYCHSVSRAGRAGSVPRPVHWHASSSALYSSANPAVIPLWSICRTGAAVGNLQCCCPKAQAGCTELHPTVL